VGIAGAKYRVLYQGAMTS